MAWYSTGTAAITQASTSVQGTGTNWIDQRPGWAMVIEGVPGLVEIAAVVSSTELRVAKPITVPSATGLAYAILPTQGLTQKLVEDVNRMIAEISNSRDAWTSVFTNFSVTAYQLWLDQGNTGTVADFLNAIKGAKGDQGATGPSVYDQWLAQGNTGDIDAFLSSLAGQAAGLAEAARDASQVAKGLSEAARDDAVAARGQAQSAADQVALDLAAVAHIYDTFDDRFLGTKSTDPTADNDGDPLLVGARYWNGPASEERVWTGTAWVVPQAAASTSAQQSLSAASDAQAAQALAEAARDSAQTDAASAGTSATNAQSAETTTLAARDEVITARDQVQADAANLNTAVVDAQTAKVGAETARDAAQGHAVTAASSASSAGTDAALASGKASEAAASVTNAQAAQAASEGARDIAQAWAITAEDTEVQPGSYSALHHAEKARQHAQVASIASNSVEWVSGMSITRGLLYWSPITLQTYRAALDRAVSSTDPSQDTSTFVLSSGGGGGGGGAQFANFNVDGNGDLILSFYDPGGNVNAADFSIDANGNLLVEISA